MYKNRTPTFAIHGDPGNFLLQLAKNFPMEFNNNWLEWKQKLYQIDNEKELKIENDIKSSLERKNVNFYNFFKNNFIKRKKLSTLFIYVMKLKK